MGVFGYTCEQGKLFALWQENLISGCSSFLDGTSVVDILDVNDDDDFCNHSQEITMGLDVHNIPVYLCVKLSIKPAVCFDQVSFNKTHKSKYCKILKFPMLRAIVQLVLGLISL